MSAPFDLSEADRLLSTTRAVRRRLDLDRPVERSLLLECIELSQQAPTPSNSQRWRWLVVTDAATRSALAELYRRGGEGYFASRPAPSSDQARRVRESAAWLAEHLGAVPVHVLPCLEGRLEPGNQLAAISALGGIFPAVWSFQLALRARGLGSVLTTFHLAHAAEAAQLLGIPEKITQVGLLAVAYTKGTDFRPAQRPPVEQIVHFERWGSSS